MKKPPRSKLEADLDASLKQLFPNETIKHDMPIKIGKQTLYVDRIIQSKGLAFEVDGRQHDEFVGFLHGSKSGFESSKLRDFTKEQWLYQQGYTLIRFKHTDSLDFESVKNKILKELTSGN